MIHYTIAKNRGQHTPPAASAFSADTGARQSPGLSERIIQILSIQKQEQPPLLGHPCTGGIRVPRSARIEAQRMRICPGKGRTAPSIDLAPLCGVKCPLFSVRASVRRMRSSPAPPPGAKPSACGFVPEKEEQHLRSIWRRFAASNDPWCCSDVVVRLFITDLVNRRWAACSLKNRKPDHTIKNTSFGSIAAEGDVSWVVPFRSYIQIAHPDCRQILLHSFQLLQIVL